jgi:hypothetical protein
LSPKSFLGSANPGFERRQDAPKTLICLSRHTAERGIVANDADHWEGGHGRNDTLVRTGLVHDYVAGQQQSNLGLDL